MRTIDIEIAIARYFNPRVNIIIPNVSWGFNGYYHNEIDLMIITKHDYLYEIEIKVSLSDLKKDLKKIGAHQLKEINRLYFAIPESLEKHIEHIPNHAGILVVKEKEHECRYGLQRNNDVRKLRESIKMGNAIITPKQKERFLRLAAMRIWPLKTNISKLLPPVPPPNKADSER